MKIQQFIKISVCLIIFLIIIVPKSFAENTSTEIKGIYTIETFPESELLKLDGSWEFYWNQLYAPEDFEKRSNIRKSYIEIPHGTNGYILSDGRIENTGHATYRLTVHFPKEEIGSIKALYIPSLGSAYTLWVNGEVTARNGVVGESVKSMQPSNSSKLAFFHVSSKDVEIVIQNSNYNQRRAGIYDSILLGNPNVISNFQSGKVIFRSITAASLLIIALYHFALFAFRKKEYSLLFFAFLCLFIAIRSIIFEESLVNFIFPFLSWDVASKIEYLGAILGTLSFSLFTYSLYPKDMNDFIRNLIIFVTTLYSCFIIFTPVLTSTRYMVLMTIIIISIFAYLVYVHVLVFLRKRKGSYLIIIGLITLFISTVNDTLFFNNIIQSIELTSISLVVYLFIQSINISRNYSLSFKRSDQLAKDLAKLNDSLENKVQTRTAELKVLNNELLDVNEKLKTAHQSQSKLITNISHEIGSPLTIIRSYTKGMLDGIVKKDEQYISLLYDKSVYLSKILDDLIALSDIETHQIKFNLEKVEISQYCKKIFNKFRLVLHQKGIQFEFNDKIPNNEKPIYVLLDETRIEQVFENLINNALRFIDEKNGEICLKLMKKDERHILINVIDNGIGIKPEALSLVFERFYSKNAKDHGGAGLGLSISKEIIERHDGRIEVESKWNEGACFSITLPIMKE